MEGLAALVQKDSLDFLDLLEQLGNLASQVPTGLNLTGLSESLYLITLYLITLHTVSMIVLVLVSTVPLMSFVDRAFFRNLLSSVPWTGHHTHNLAMTMWGAKCGQSQT